jgi:hypothetical protein
MTMRKLLFWLVWNIPLGRFAPWILGVALGSKPIKLKAGDKDYQTWKK